MAALNTVIPDIFELTMTEIARTEDIALLAEVDVHPDH